MAVQFRIVEPATASAVIDAAWREFAEVEAAVAAAEERDGRLEASRAEADDDLRRKYRIGGAR